MARKRKRPVPKRLVLESIDASLRRLSLALAWDALTAQERIEFRDRAMRMIHTMREIS